MQITIIVATVLAAAVAKPELYKEKEDFQYSRSSSDEGTKSGFYGAQRGNMGGNYERAHNMDGTAQNQMSGLIRQVNGEYGDALNSKTGSVFTSANSKGIYGSGNHDLSSLQGRDFREGTSYTDSTSATRNSNYQHASSHNMGYHNAHTHESTQQGLGNYYGQNFDGTNTATENLGSGSYGHTGQSSQYHRESGYNRESGYQGNYAQSNSKLYDSQGYGSNVKSRLVSATPVRVIVRPGGRVAIPVAAQTYDATHRDTASHSEDNYNINSEAADLNSIDSVGVKPTSTGKHYESSYKYHKEWEKHDTKPGVVPLAIPTESSIVSDNQQYNYHSNRGSNSHSGYNVKSSSQAHHQSNYNAQEYGLNSISSNAYKQNTDLVSKTNQDALTEVLGQNKPSNYQSSYSYHKAWERQGDPYVIIPGSSSNQASQRIYSSNQHYQNAECDCDENGHIRLSRSISQEQEVQNFNDVGQQVQNFDDFSQHSQNLMDFGQQSQNLEDFGQQAQNLEDFGQQTQNLEDFGQQTQNLESFNQHRQNLGQQTQNLETFGQQSQNLGQQTQNLETFGQQSQNIGQQTQSQKLEDLGQQTQNLDTFGQQTQNLENLGQQTQSQNLEDLGQQTHKESLYNFGHQKQNRWNRWENLGQQEQQSIVDGFDDHKIAKRSDNEKYKNVGQQTKESWRQFKSEGNWANKDSVRQKNENEWNQAKSQNRRRRENTGDWQNYKELGQQTHKNWEEYRAEGKWENAGVLREQTRTEWQDARNKYGEHNHHEHRDHDHH